MLLAPSTAEPCGRRLSAPAGFEFGEAIVNAREAVVHAGFEGRQPALHSIKAGIHLSPSRNLLEARVYCVEARVYRVEARAYRVSKIEKYIEDLAAGGFVHVRKFSIVRAMHLARRKPMLGA